MIDIVLTTRNRLEYLKKTLVHIYERTYTPYRLHVIDDASSEGNVEYLFREWKCGRVHDLLLRGIRCGAMANLNTGTWLAFSDPVVFCDDDVLCPKLQPDWLAQGCEVMRRYPKLALLSLNHPGAKHKSMEQGWGVTFCKSIGGTFMFVRRKFLMQYQLSHERDNFSPKPTDLRCKAALKRGWKIGYLTNVYCHHIGRWSAITETEYSGRDVEPANWDTLEV